jgi:hypothetical protein
LYEGTVGRSIITDCSLTEEEQSRRLGRGLGSLATIGLAPRATRFGTTLGGQVTSRQAGLFADDFQLTNFQLTNTVENHRYDIITRGEYRGQLSRPYLDSPLMINEIMEARPPIPDPGGVPDALRWDVPGSFRGSDGTWVLVVDPNTNTVLHFVFEK